MHPALSQAHAGMRSLPLTCSLVPVVPKEQTQAQECKQQSGKAKSQAACPCSWLCPELAVCPGPGGLALLSQLPHWWGEHSDRPSARGLVEDQARCSPSTVPRT